MPTALQISPTTVVNSIVISNEPVCEVTAAGIVRQIPPTPFPYRFGAMIYDGCTSNQTIACDPSIRAVDALLSGVRCPDEIWYRCEDCGCRVKLSVRPPLKQSQARHHPVGTHLDPLRRYTPPPTLAARSKHDARCRHEMSKVKRRQRARWRKTQVRHWVSALDAVRNQVKQNRLSGGSTFEVKLSRSGVTDVRQTGGDALRNGFVGGHHPGIIRPGSPAYRFS